MYVHIPTHSIRSYINPYVHIFLCLEPYLNEALQLVSLMWPTEEGSGSARHLDPRVPASPGALGHILLHDCMWLFL